MDASLEQFINKNSTRAEEYKDVIEDMLASGNRYTYAESTLVGILEYIEENDNITDAQIRVVGNIKDEPSNRYG